jgi:hypothetical protein
MPKKSRREKILQSKRKQVRSQQPIIAEPQEIAQPEKAAVSPTKVATGVKPAPKAGIYPFVTAELRSISILAGIILVILIILAVVLQ